MRSEKESDLFLNILESIESPENLKNLSVGELTELCEQIRFFLISSLSRTGGHLASNLGTVELSVALHRVFDSPVDKIIWDVGHQSYTHKILTGRRKMFDTLRLESGISGFPRTSESEHDAFISGHSSTSISAACGMAEAKQLRGEGGKVIAVIGDGAFTGGMAYEAINNARNLKNLIVILNDNKMSISKNVGAFAHYLADLRTKPKYLKTKVSVENFLDHVPFAGRIVKKALLSSKFAIKNLIFNINFFTDLGFSYFGPVDGHEIKDLINALKRVKSLDCPVFIHIDTVKGKGYSHAEENPGAFHGISKFDIMTGDSDIPEANSYSDVFGKELERLAFEDKSICAITAAMKYGTGLQYFKSSFPERFFDVGIAEQHAVTFAAGLSAGGIKPVFAVYSSFLQRSYDQIIHDASIESRHVVLAVDRAGIVGSDGETHQGVFDVSFLSSIPGITIFSPCGFSELRDCLYKALYEYSGVVAIRYPRGGEETDTSGCSGDFHHIPAEAKGPESDILIITYGRLFEQALKAQSTLLDRGIKIALLKITKLFPISNEIVKCIINYKKIYFFEEGIQCGGIGEKLLFELYKNGFRDKYEIIAINGEFVPQADINTALKKLGLDFSSMMDKILESTED